MNKEKIWFYQNNPCKIVNEINDDFVEISINHQYGAEMELMCMGCAVGDSDNKLRCTCSDMEWIVEQVQDEDHLSLVVARRIYLRENPVEYFDILKLQREINEHREKLKKIKDLRCEWSESVKSLQKREEILKANITSASDELSLIKNEIDSLSKSHENLKETHDKMKVGVTRGSFGRFAKEITMSDYEGLQKRSDILSALEAGGVDNWEWYDESLGKMEKR